MKRRTLEHLAAPHPQLYNALLNGVVPEVMWLFKRGVRHTNGEVLHGIHTAYLLAPTHRSILDIPAVGLAVGRETGDQIHFMAKQELWDVRPFGKLIEMCGAFPVSQKEQLPAETITHVEGILRNDGIVGIFPEGKRLKGPTVERHNLKRGVARFALQHGLPVVPVGIAGTERGISGPVEVVFGEPIAVEQQVTNFDSLKDLVRTTRPVLDVLHAGMQAAMDQAVSLNS